MLFFLIWFALQFFNERYFGWLFFQSGNFGRRRIPLRAIVCRAQRKPPWVKRELVRLKALMPLAGCRTLTDVFNRKFAATRKMTVGKTFVASVISQHRYEIQVLRKQIKHAKPKRVPVNWVWGMDLTGKTDTGGKLHMLLGILDHGSRALLCLRALPNKSSWTLLGHFFGYWQLR